MTDTNLVVALDEVNDIEQAIRRHLGATAGAWEQQRGQVAYRHAIGLRRALQEWQDTRALLTAQQEIVHG